VVWRVVRADSQPAAPMSAPAANEAAAAAAAAADAAGLALTPSQPATQCTGAPPSSPARSCQIVDTDSICLDANLGDEFKWPSDKMRARGGLSEWPLWGWLGALQGRTGRVVYVWERKPKDGKENTAVVPKKCCKGSRQAGFRFKDALPEAMEKTMLLLEIDQHYVPILEEVGLPAHKLPWLRLAAPPSAGSKWVRVSCPAGSAPRVTAAAHWHSARPRVGAHSTHALSTRAPRTRARRTCCHT